MRPNGGIYITYLILMLTCVSFSASDWGFYAHRKINFYAALTVPPPLNQFFKTHIEYLRVHAVDPDKRRYAAPEEGPRHYIDLDRWYVSDSCVLSRDYTTDRLMLGHWEWRTDSSVTKLTPMWDRNQRILFKGSGIPSISIDSFGIRQEIIYQNADSSTVVSSFLYPHLNGALCFVDSFSQHGIVPYYVERLYARLVQEMESQNVEAVLKISADLGHYISDAHVPLHTTSNYNGQFTDQIGIHAFWESRIPELYETSHFHSLAGRARYVPDIREYIWKIVENSYRLVPRVLATEEKARASIPEQKHFCYEERGNNLVRTQCPELTKKYMDLMDGMVQERWLESIRAVGTVWYSAWIDAGQPELWEEDFIANPDTGFLQRILDKVGVFTGGRNALH